MKNIYITPDVLILHMDMEGLICSSINGNVSVGIGPIGDGTDYGDL